MKKTMPLPLLLLGYLLLASTASNSEGVARETKVTLHSTVTGNQEQPRVMYIVPWDQPGDSRTEHTFQRTVASELFAPIDREEFIRSMAYQTKVNIEKQGEDHGKL